MKYLSIPLIMVLFACNNNKRTNQLLNEKKALTDSVTLAKIKQENYFEKALTEKSEGVDSMVWSALVDTSFGYDRQVAIMQQRLKAIDFSLDSLSRMK